MPRISKSALDERIEARCERKGLVFGPHEMPPWEVDHEPSPYGPMSAGNLTWKPAQRLRRQLLT
jgi:hypothetical protein